MTKEGATCNKEASPLLWPLLSICNLSEVIPTRKLKFCLPGLHQFPQKRKHGNCDTLCYRDTCRTGREQKRVHFPAKLGKKPGDAHSSHGGVILQTEEEQDGHGAGAGPPGRAEPSSPPLRGQELTPAEAHAGRGAGGVAERREWERPLRSHPEMGHVGFSRFSPASHGFIHSCLGSFFSSATRE